MANMTTANIGFKSILGYSQEGLAYTGALQVVDISGPDIDVAEVKVSNNDLVEPWHEKIPGMVDPGTLTFNCIYVKGGLAALAALLPTAAQPRPIRYWRVSYPDNSTWICQGFLKRLNTGAPLEDRETVDVTVCFTGKANFTAG